MKTKDNALAVINRIRSSAGRGTIDTLPAGLRSDPAGCVIARALWDIAPEIQIFTTNVVVEDFNFANIILSVVGMDEEIECILTDSEETKYVVPIDVSLAEFIWDFDKNVYPELALAGSPANCFE